MQRRRTLLSGWSIIRIDALKASMNRTGGKVLCSLAYVHGRNSTSLRQPFDLTGREKQLSVERLKEIRHCLARICVLLGVFPARRMIADDPVAERFALGAAQ